MSQHGYPERLSNMSKGYQDDGAGASTMEVLVETLTGTAFEMTVSPSDTIFAIKSKIFRVEGIPIWQQHLVYRLQELEDSRSLRSLRIRGGARLRLVLGMRGGPLAARRLALPPAASLTDIHREDAEFGGGCKVVVVFRDGDRVNMLRVRRDKLGPHPDDDDDDIEASPLPAEPQECEPASALHDNAVTMGKMADLRRRMEQMCLQRRTRAGGVMQKTRSEELLSQHELPPITPRRHRHADHLHLEEENEVHLPECVSTSILYESCSTSALEQGLAADDGLTRERLVTDCLPPIAADYECGGGGWLAARCSSTSRLLEAGGGGAALARHEPREQLHLAAAHERALPDHHQSGDGVCVEKRRDKRCALCRRRRARRCSHPHHDALPPM